MKGIHTTGEYYKHFIEKAEYPYTEEERACIKNTISKLGDVETLGSKPGMLLGKIQSGKTKTFLAIIGLAFDNDYDIAIILTKGTKALAKQTEQRIQREFKPFHDRDEILIYDIMNMPDKLGGWELKKKIILVVKKQKDNFDRLQNIFLKKHKILSDKRALIIDDEADYASVGYKKKGGEIDANLTAHKLDDLRNSVRHASFLQVTATPYSLYLQPESVEVKGISFLPARPAFTELVPVNTAYIGSDYYFDSDYSDLLYIPLTANELTTLRKKDGRRLKITDVLTSSAVQGLRDAFCNFLVGGCIRQLQAIYNNTLKSKFSLLVHTEVSKDTHLWQEEVVNALCNALNNEAKKNTDLFSSLISRAYQEIKASIELSKFHLPTKEDVTQRVQEALIDEEVLISSINSDKQVEALLDDSGQLRLRTPFNIFIGGQILDRGITIGGLIGFFYGRAPKRFQQDTVLQHSRMYGYRPKEDLAVTRFYTAPTIYNAMKKMHESDVALREAIERNPQESVRFIQGSSSGTIVPCSPNKILLTETTTLKPYKRILPIGFQTDYKTRTNKITEHIDKLLLDVCPSGASSAPFKITTSLAHTILIESAKAIIMEEEEGYKFDWDSMHAAIDYMAEQSSNPNEIWCLWLTNRNNARLAGIGSHTRYVATPDTATTEGAIAKKYAKDSPMLMLFRQNGSDSKEKGWMGAPFYWPLLYASGKVPTTIYANRTSE
ncbi:Z1 domain-containing protein [Cellvibrio sp. PSBB023]|uniref:Z1 domain-containing protein n=1 Tax=Cellvibrio sp. PSBB023 TaxID=1945512 RepID=UPI00098FF4C2|nr:Z1 domain-containing protein [Cellvibrio sp. PSBB023]AQT61074.1 hypothetical protein B0D95_13965 [Cellvibrio sp. PSBB023]